MLHHKHPSLQSHLQVDMMGTRLQPWWRWASPGQVGTAGVRVCLSCRSTGSSSSSWLLEHKAIPGAAPSADSQCRSRAAHGAPPEGAGEQLLLLGMRGLKHFAFFHVPMIMVLDFP